MSEQLIANLASAFKPVPLPAGSPFYVALKEVRADADVCKDLGRKIIRSLPTEYTHQLYTGHRGGGKSTELLRLKKHLEQNNCFVVYFVQQMKKISIQKMLNIQILSLPVRALEQL